MSDDVPRKFMGIPRGQGKMSAPKPEASDQAGRPVRNISPPTEGQTMDPFVGGRGHGMGTVTRGRGTIDAPLGRGLGSQPAREIPIAGASGFNPNGDSDRGGIRGKRNLPSHDLGKDRPSRPPQTLVTNKTGTSGTSIKLISNYFRLIKKPTWCLTQYHVDFAPEVEINAVRKGLLRTHKDLLGGFIFDGTNLYLSNSLDKDVVEVFSKNRMDETIRITIRMVGVISMMEERCVQILNIIMRKALEGLKLQLVGRNYFDPMAKINIREHNLELWPGYLTSIRQHQQDILLCAEITHKVMRTDTVFDLLRKTIEKCRGASWHDEFIKAVIGTTVLTDYNNKFYRVDDVDFKTTPASTFETKDGPVSYMEYYKTKYGKIIRDKGQPLLISNAKARDIRAGKSEFIALVPELCRATGITDEMRGNFHLMRAMSDFTRVQPDGRITKLVEFNRRLYSSPESLDVFKEWQMTLDKNLVEFTGRELTNEAIVFGNGVKVKTDRNADWTAQFRGTNNLFNTMYLNNWAVIHLNQQTQVVKDFIGVMIDTASKMGFRIDQPKYKQIQDDRSQTYSSMIDQCINSMDAQLVMCVLPNNRADRYSAIKKKCCVENAIPSQMVLAKTITPKRGAPPRSTMTIATKVAIQINCKLGHSPWNIVMPLSGAMTIGFDVCHDTTSKAKSFGAFVASMDLKSTRTKYYSAVSSHKNGEELSNDIGNYTLKALQLFREIEGSLPAKIIFYRDGVGEGQYQYVIDHEIANIKSKLDQVYKSQNGTYGFAFIVVNKRNNSRFFTANRSNPNPGTIVDSVVTAPELYDFYLVSQSVRQGTVSPTYYIVLSDSLGLPADKLQIYTYKMCHLYYNWSGTTRVPAVCQYAHKLAFLVGQFIHHAPNNQLQKQLYFL